MSLLDHTIKTLLPLFHFVWVKLLTCRKSHMKQSFENFQKQGLISLLEVIKAVHLMKRSRAILGRNSARDNQMQIVLNNATLGNGIIAAAPHHK